MAEVTKAPKIIYADTDSVFITNISLSDEYFKIFKNFLKLTKKRHFGSPPNDKTRPRKIATLVFTPELDKFFLRFPIEQDRPMTLVKVDNDLPILPSTLFLSMSSSIRPDFSSPYPSNDAPKIRFPVYEVEWSTSNSKRNTYTSESCKQVVPLSEFCPEKVDLGTPTCHEDGRVTFPIFCPSIETPKITMNFKIKSQLEEMTENEGVTVQEKRDSLLDVPKCEPIFDTEKDIDIILSQVGNHITREQVRNALEQNNGDIVNAILSLPTEYNLVLVELNNDLPILPSTVFPNFHNNYIKDKE